MFGSDAVFLYVGPCCSVPGESSARLDGASVLFGCKLSSLVWGYQGSSKGPACLVLWPDATMRLLCGPGHPGETLGRCRWERGRGMGEAQGPGWRSSRLGPAGEARVVSGLSTPGWVRPCNHGGRCWVRRWVVALELAEGERLQGHVGIIG